MENGESLNNSQGKRQAMDTNPTMTQMLKLWHRDHAPRAKDQRFGNKWKDRPSQQGKKRYKTEQNGNFRTGKHKNQNLKYTWWTQ